MLLSVIIPMYNEENVVFETAETLLSRLRRTGYDFEIIFSDDGSVDRTAEIVSAIAAENPEVRLLRSEENKGKGHAVRLGMAESLGDYAVFTDCDLAYGVEVILQVLDKLRDTNADICIGSRALHPSGYAEYPRFRRIFSKSYVKILKNTASFSYSDAQCGIKGFDRRVCEPLFEGCKVDGFAFDLEILMLADSMGIRVCEIPVRILNHVPENSKVRAVRDAFKMLSDVRTIKKNISSTRKERITDEV